MSRENSPMPKCRKCGQGPIAASGRGAYLDRMNEKGVPGVWQCNPSCDHLHGGQEEALTAALEANVEDVAP